jgi:hypothetical protein
MIRICSLVLIGSLFFASSTFAQDIDRSQIQKLVRIEPAHASYLLPPQGQTAASSSAAKPSGTSHRKRNIIIAVVVAGAVAGVIVAAHNGAYGSSSNMTTGY